MADTRIDIHTREIGKILTDPEVRKLVRLAAEEGKRYAESIAPDAPPYGQGYKQSFRVESGLTHTYKGVSRAEARLVNDAPYAAAVEWANGDRVLGRTADHIEKWKPGG